MRKPDASAWTLVAEVLAWAVVGTVGIVLMHVRAPVFPVLAVLVLLFGVAVTYLRHISSKQLTAPPKTLEAECFVLKRNGSVLAKIGTGENNYGPSLALYDLTGTLRAKLALDPLEHLETSLVFYDSLGNQQIALAASEMAEDQDNPRIRLFDQHGHERVTVGIRDDGQPHVALCNGEDVTTERISLSLQGGTPRLTLADDSGVDRVQIYVGRTASLNICDAEGRSAMILTCHASGASWIIMPAGKNGPGLACRTNNGDDTLIIQISDTSGKVIWSAP